MELEMKTRCEHCGNGLQPGDEAYICSHECTFCPSCALQSNQLCSHCGGELARRPRRAELLFRPAVAQAEVLAPGRPWIIWAVSFGVWGLIALAATASIAEFYRSRDITMKFFDTLGMECSQILPYAPLTPFIYALAIRYPMRRRNWLRRLVLYTAAGVLFSLAHVAMRGVTHYAYWDSYNKTFRSAVWDTKAHKLTIQWEAIKSIFFSVVVDDISGACLPIILTAHMVSLYQRSRERERRAAHLETQLAKANLQNLKAQLQPHFLFNTMHSISALMLTDVGAADKMMARRSDLLRMSLESGGEQITTLSHELEFVTAYIDIEKMRLGDRLNVVLDFASDTLHAQVPHLLLQPLVENAIKHGVSKISSPGEVSVLTTREDGRLHLMITDNGPGLGVTPKASFGGGLGLRATQERLRTLYGSNQRLEIRSKPGDGVEVSVEIPFRAAMLEQQEVVGL